MLADGPIVEWPALLLPGLLPPPAPAAAPARARCAPAVSGERARRYATAALRRAVVRIASTREGSRNDSLNAESFGLARFVREGALSPRELAAALAHAALAAGLPPLEIERTIASALGAGAAR